MRRDRMIEAAAAVRKEAISHLDQDHRWYIATMRDIHHRLSDYPTREQFFEALDDLMAGVPYHRHVIEKAFDYNNRSHVQIFHAWRDFPLAIWAALIIGVQVGAFVTALVIGMVKGYMGG